MPSPFGLGSQIFLDGTPILDRLLNEDSSDNESDLSCSSDDTSLITAIASAAFAESEWDSAPFYSALYLSTASEYLPPAPKVKLPPGAQIQDPEDDATGNKDSSWTFEAYENSLKIDHVFERFTERVGHESKQCIR
jgi:pre-rRNA-processing protein TSR4